jgi:predicted metal-dependent hydrolase
MQLLQYDKLKLVQRGEIWCCRGQGVNLPVVRRINARARHMVLRVSPCGQEIRLTMPKHARQTRAFEFLKAQLPWLEEQLVARPEPIILEPGAKVPLFGRQCVLQHDASMQGIHYTGRRLVIGGQKEHFSRRIQEAIRKQAIEIFGDMAREMASDIGKRIAMVGVREMQARWGSCTNDRRIYYNWRLAFAPKNVFTYVIAHEVAHLKHFDHSPRFWDCVDGLCSQMEKARGWLSENGKDLHRYQ